MPRTYIYMNEQIRLAKPERPVIVAQTGKKRVESNRVDILHDGKVIASVVYQPGGCPSSTHIAKAYVETECEVRAAHG